MRKNILNQIKSEENQATRRSTSSKNISQSRSRKSPPSR